MSETHTPRVDEHWVYGGTRVGLKDKKFAAWIDPSGEELYFPYASRYIVGSIYTFSVLREGDQISRRPQGEYVGRSDDNELRTTLHARHRAAETALDEIRRQRADKRDDPLDDAIEALASLVRAVPSPQRQAFAVYLMTRFTKAWTRPAR